MDFIFDLPAFPDAVTILDADVEAEYGMMYDCRSTKMTDPPPGGWGFEVSGEPLRFLVNGAPRD
jgi:hypothetical protein